MKVILGLPCQFIQMTAQGFNAELNLRDWILGELHQILTKIRTQCASLPLPPRKHLHRVICTPSFSYLRLPVLRRFLLFLCIYTSLLHLWRQVTWAKDSLGDSCPYHAPRSGHTFAHKWILTTEGRIPLNIWQDPWTRPGSLTRPFGKIKSTAWSGASRSWLVHQNPTGYQ